MPSSDARVLVVDASAFVDLVLNRPLAAVLRKRLIESGASLHAPMIADLEVLQTIRGYVLIGDLTVARAEEAIEDYLDIRLERYPHDPLLWEIWQLRSNFTPYDASYVVLAEQLKATLVTLDLRLARACPPTVRTETYP
ncbi:MAG TPA: type II toxin-antitoxin system VapC family toxin [Thermoanaerobaculia bacterium]|nr:type II toxin-antitoxin system VapC family toxin [Thermoanaerobaculia bacterium]